MVPLSISVHGLGGLVNVCVQVSNNNQAVGLLRGFKSEPPLFKGCLISLVINTAGTTRGQALTTELRGVQSVANSSASSIFYISFD